MKTVLKDILLAICSDLITPNLVINLKKIHVFNNYLS